MVQLTATLNQTTIRVNHCPGVGHFSDGKVGQISSGIYSLRCELVVTQRGQEADDAGGDFLGDLSEAMVFNKLGTGQYV